MKKRGHIVFSNRSLYDEAGRCRCGHTDEDWCVTLDDLIRIGLGDIPRDRITPSMIEYARQHPDAEWQGSEQAS